MGVLSVRLDEDLEKKLEYIMQQRKIIDKSAYIRQLLSKSIKDDLITFLCEEVKEKRMSAWKAAEIAQISLRAFQSELSKREITTYTESAFAEDLNFILE